MLLKERRWVASLRVEKAGSATSSRKHCSKSARVWLTWQSRKTAFSVGADGLPSRSSEKPGAAGRPPTRRCRFGATAFGWHSERRRIGADGLPSRRSEKPGAAGRPPTRRCRFGATAFAWLSERRRIGADGLPSRSSEKPGAAGRRLRGVAATARQPSHGFLSE